MCGPLRSGILLNGGNERTYDSSFLLFLLIRVTWSVHTNKKIFTFQDLLGIDDNLAQEIEALLLEDRY